MNSYEVLPATNSGTPPPRISNEFTREGVVFRWYHTWDVTPGSPVRTLVTWVKTL